MPRHFCNQPEHRISRRKLLFGAAQASAFLALAPKGEAQTASPAVNPRKTAKACIFITMTGAPSHVDTWDPKDGPWNPPDVNLQQHSGGVGGRPHGVVGMALFPRREYVMRAVEIQTVKQ